MSGDRQSLFKNFSGSPANFSEEVDGPIQAHEPVSAVCARTQHKVPVVKGEEGLYLGFSHLHSFISSVAGFSLSGILLDRYCPAPDKFTDPAAWELAKQNAHYIWFVFVGIAFVAALALIAYGRITRRMDERAA